MNKQTRSIYLTIRCDVPSDITSMDFINECEIIVKYDNIEIGQTVEESKEA